jgi:enoyl-CoA hydratase
MTQEVQVTLDEGVMVITINRPEAKNAINKNVAEAIAYALDRLDAEDEARVAIITGAGGTFCAGMDLKGFINGELPIVEGRGFAGFCERGPEKPLIAAVEGYALAGGCEMVMACDLVVASEAVKFGLPEVKRGLIAAAGGLAYFPRQIPGKVAMELALTGDFFDASRAYELGFINRVTSVGGALVEAMALARTICANGPLAVTGTKRVIKESQDWLTKDIIEHQKKVVDPIFSSEDALEGAKAFAEKRTPVWRGK